MKLTGIIASLLFIIFFPAVASAGVIHAESGSGQDTVKFVSPFQKENEACLKCHGRKTYEYAADSTGRPVKGSMSEEFIVERDRFYQSNHRSLMCTDCHSKDYSTYPHARELKNEQIPECLYCHEEFEQTAGYHFDRIETQYHNSIHYNLKDRGFSCWKCHDSHYYKVTVPGASDIRKIIAYDNDICLGCHDNQAEYKKFSDKNLPRIYKLHKWLPDRMAHFRSVRCFDCHAVKDTIVKVSHLIVSKEKALKDCKACHTEKSSIIADIYGYGPDERNGGNHPGTGSFNGADLIGAGKNDFLKDASLVIFAVILLFISIHIVLRIAVRRKF